MTKAIKEPVKSSIKYIKVAGLVGTIGFTGYDAFESWGKGERVGAGIDIVSGVAGVGLGAGLAVMGFGAVTIFTVGVASSYGFDYLADKGKNFYYKRNE